MATLDSISTDLVDDTEVISYSTNGDMATATQDLLTGSTNKTTQGLWRKGVLVQIQGWCSWSWVATLRYSGWLVVIPATSKAIRPIL